MKKIHKILPFEYVSLLIFFLAIVVLLKCLSTIILVGLGNKSIAATPSRSRTLYLLTWPYIQQSEVQQFNIGQANYFEKKYEKSTKDYESALNAMGKKDKRRCTIEIQLANAMMRPYEKDFESGTLEQHRREAEKAIDLLDSCLTVEPGNKTALKNKEIIKKALEKSPSAQQPQQKQDQSGSSREIEVQQRDQAAQQAQKEQRDNSNTKEILEIDTTKPNW